MKTLKRESDSLLSIRDNYPKILISRTHKQEHDIEGPYIIDINQLANEWLIKQIYQICLFKRITFMNISNSFFSEQVFIFIP